MTPDEEIVWWYTFEHELGHNHPELQGVWKMMKEKKLSIDSLLGLAYNCLEDHRQELYGSGDYRGRDRRIQDGFHRFVTTRFQPEIFGRIPDPKRQAAEALMVADIDWRVDWMPRLGGVSRHLSSKFNTDMAGWYEKLIEGDYGTILKSGIDEYECYDLALRILDEVFEIPPEEAEKEAQEAYDAARDGDGEGDSGSSRANPGDGEEVDDDASGKAVSDDESSDGGDGEESKRTTGGRVNYRDLLAHCHDGDKSGLYAQEEGESNTSLTIDYSDWESGEHWPNRSADQYDLVDYVKDPATRMHSYGQAGSEIAAGNSLSKKVKRHLMLKGQARYEHAQKRGKISPKSLYRAGVGNGEHSRKVFKKKQTNDMLDTAVMVLVDFSGSMGGPKMENASASMLLLNDAIGPLGIPLEIIGFTDAYSVRHGLLKGFNKRISSDQLARNIGDFASRGMHSNSDGESLLFAYDRLTRQQSKRKILLVLSDGQPASVVGDSYGHTIHVAKEIEKAGVVELCSIGIMDDTVSTIYNNWKVIHHSNQLEGAVLSVIKNHIVKYS
jgi:cobalamin biosynthesis protein CobT